MKRIVIYLLIFSMLVSNICYAADNTNASKVIVDEKNHTITVDKRKYSEKEFEKLLENAEETKTINNDGRRKTVAVAAGSFVIPGIGKALITAAEKVVLGGTAVAATSWVSKKVTTWYKTRQDIKAIKSKIPSRLKDGKGNIDIGKFNKKVAQSLFLWDLGFRS